MKRICLVRHGKAESPIPEKPDYDRILSDIGEHDMKKIARMMKKLGIKPSVIISSPAPRAYQTARIAAKEFGYPLKKIRTRTAIYDQLGTAFSDIIETLDDADDSVMIVGHNPSISEYAWFLAKKFKKELPTSGFAVIDCKVKSWGDIKERSGKCICYDCPGMKNTSAHDKMLRSALQAAISEQVEKVLDYYEPNARKKLKNSIKKSTESIAQAYVKKFLGKKGKK